jgi:hypothetical protein
MNHFHAFKSWPFNLPVETGVFTTRQVMEGREPIREVYHDPDGDWQFLCGTTLDTVDLKLVCLGCMLEMDPTVGELADMPPRWCASRQSTDAEWIQEPYEPREDETDEHAQGE